MSRNVVDCVIEACTLSNFKIGFIPSRRQIEYNGGYVNNWTTKSFSDYVNGRVVICRDHGGGGQGAEDDDGYESFNHDAKYFDIVHVDPWKKHQDYENGLKFTVDYINYLHELNPNLFFEIGTEEAIRPFSFKELDKLIFDLSKKLKSQVFSRIVYAVVQSGVGLNLGKLVNTGTFDADRLSKMVQVCNKYGILSKEHNGDYLKKEEIDLRFKIGLNSINIAPEFGQIETKCYLEEMADNIEEYYQICHESKKWCKWVDKSFNPEQNKKELIQICGHYILSDRRFLDIKCSIDQKIKSKIHQHIKYIY
jgi:hypothetical protein